MCEDVYLLMFVVNGDTCTFDDFKLMMFISVKIMKCNLYECDLWSFGDDDFLAYTLKWWVVFVELIRLNEE